MTGHGAARYKSGCRCVVCRQAHRARTRANRALKRVDLAARHEAACQVVPSCLCAWCVGARGSGARPGTSRDARAVVCCETEAFEQEGAGHDPYCPTVIGGAA